MSIFRKPEFLVAEKGFPLLLGAKKGVAIDMGLDAGDRAVGLVLPKMPGPRPVFDGRLILHRSDPDRVIHEGAVRKDRLVEVDGRIDDRPLAVVPLHLVEHHLHLGNGVFLSEMPMAGLRRRRRLNIQDRRQRVALDRGVLLEIGHLLHWRPAPIDEMIGSAWDSGRFRARPIGLEARVGVIAAFGRLDPGKFDAAARDRVPVDVALELGYVNAVDRVVGRPRQIRAERIQRTHAAAATRERDGERKRTCAQDTGNEILAVRHRQPVKIAPRTVVSPDDRV